MANILTDDLRTMIQLRRSGKTAAEAYSTVFPIADDVPRAQLNNIAAAAFRMKCVREEMERLDKEDQRAIRQQAEADAKSCRKIWSRTDSVQRLVDILNDCEATRKESMQTGDGVPVPVARLERDTVDSLNKMMGYNEPEKSEVDTTMNIVFDDGGYGV